MQVIFDLHLGEAQVGGIRVPIAEVGHEGQIQVNGEDGPVLRPISFGERMRAVRNAQAAGDPVETLSVEILRLATVSAGTADHEVVQIIALKLAGAGTQAPLFHETISLVANATGWTPAQLYDAQAVEIDWLAINLADPQLKSTWNRLLMPSEESGMLATFKVAFASGLFRRLQGHTIAQGAKDDGEISLPNSPVSLPLSAKEHDWDTIQLNQFHPTSETNTDGLAVGAKGQQVEHSDSSIQPTVDADLEKKSLSISQRTIPDAATESAAGVSTSTDHVVNVVSDHPVDAASDYAVDAAVEPPNSPPLILNRSAPDFAFRLQPRRSPQKEHQLAQRATQTNADRPRFSFRLSKVRRPIESATSSFAGDGLPQITQGQPLPAIKKEPARAKHVDQHAIEEMRATVNAQMAGWEAELAAKLQEEADLRGMDR